MSNNSIKQHLSLLCTAESTEQELLALRSLNLNLANVHDTQNDADFIEEQYLIQSKTVLEEGNPYPLFEVTEFDFPKKVGLRDFVNYIFTRRYGWSEVMPSGETLTIQRILGVGSSSKDEAVMKSHLIELLDEFIKWLLCHRLGHELLSSLQHTVQQAANHPVIRKQTFIHILEWFRSTCTVFHEEFFESSKELIVLGLTDVWSAIRSACASKLSAITEQFSISQLELLFLALVKICRDEASSWQAKEGSVMGLNVIVRRFQWVVSGDDASAQSTVTQSDSKGTEYYLKFGKASLQKIPEFISTQLHDVIFLLLSDAQLGIREHAIKTFSSYLSRCDSQEAMSSFNEVMAALCKGTGLSQEQVAKFSDMSQLILSSQFKWMNAYMAEGLLGMCIFLVKHVPPECLLPGWSLCMNTLSLYLMHPASTVRQATSKIIKFLVAKDTSNPAILKLVLTALSSDWNVDTCLLSKNCLPENFSQLPETAQVYSSCNQGHNPSIKLVHISPDQAGDIAARSDELSKTWEWREGRLLAYELLFQFLIKNHWLYTFGTVFGRSHTAFTDDTRRSQSPCNANKMRPQQSYSGSTLQAIKSSSTTVVNGAYNRSLNLREACGSHTLPAPVIMRCHSPDIYDSRFQRYSQMASPDDSREAIVRQRRATLDHLNPLVKASVSHHHPNIDRSRSSLKTADGLKVISALPLLTAVKRLEAAQLQTSAELAESPTSTSPSAPMERCSPELKPLARSEQISMDELLINILHQTVECVNSSSWELRRMSQQVMPGLVEILRWYDMSLLVSYWSIYLSTDTSVMSYGALLSFLYSVSHAAKLSPLLHDPPDNWQDLQACKEAVSNITDCMKEQLSLYIPIFVNILKRPTLDKLTVIAVQILLTSSTFISGSGDASAKSVLMSGLSDAVDCIKNVTVLCYPSGRMQKYKPPLASNRILLPGTGFLSCNPLDSEELSVTTDNLRKYLLEHTHSLLVAFLRQFDVRSSYTLLPCLLKFLRGQYSTVHINRAFTDSVLIIFEKLAPFITDLSEESFDMALRKKVYETRNDSFYELIICVTDKTADKHILHMALDCLAGLLQHADSCRYILPLLKAVCSQLSTGPGSAGQSRTCADNLEILSNDIREYMDIEPTDDSDSDDDDAALLEIDHQESLTLHNSGGTTASGRQSGLSQRSGGDVSGGMSSLHSDADSDSDWDSWDEQEEESSDKESVFQDFLQKVYQSFQNQGRLEEFNMSLKKLPPSELRVIKALLKI